jgi:hypothetical protein
MHKYAKAKLQTRSMLSTAMRAYMMYERMRDACATATANLHNQQTVGTRTPREGGATAPGHTKLLLCNATVGLKRHQGHRRTRGEFKKDTRGTRGHARGPDPRDTGGTGRHSRGVGKDTKRTGRENGGIGMDHKARGAQQKTYVYTCVCVCSMYMHVTANRVKTTASAKART